MRMNTPDSIRALQIGRELLNEFRKNIGDEEYDKIINSPVRSCKCGYIKEGDYDQCYKCEWGK